MSEGRCVEMPRPFTSCSYSPECVEGKFCELRLYDVLGSSPVKSSPMVGSMVLELRPNLHTPRGAA